MNLFLLYTLILLGISAELFADSCFYDCNDDGARKYFTSDECTCDGRIIPFSNVSRTNEITVENFIHCVTEESKNSTLLGGHCICLNTTCVSNISAANATTKTTATSSSSSTKTATTPSPSTICSNDTCLNGGTCTPSGSSNYTCNCTEDFHGPNCENSTSPCNPNPCLNNGSCTVDPHNSTMWLCSCLVGFNGTRCELPGCTSCTPDEVCQHNVTTGEVQCTNSRNSTTETGGTNTTKTTETGDTNTTKTTETGDTNTTKTTETGDTNTTKTTETGDTNTTKTTETGDTNTTKTTETGNTNTTETTEANITTTTEKTDANTTEGSSDTKTNTATITDTDKPPTTTTSDMNTTLDTAVLPNVTINFNESTTSEPDGWSEYDRRALIIGLAVGIPCFILLIAGIAGLTIYLKKSRATTGKYEPSKEEKQGTNMYYNILALPPEEKLI